MPKLIDKLTLFFPTYNEEGNIETVVLKAGKVLEEVAGQWEIIIINDGSRDRTGEIAAKLSKSDKRVRVITNSPNRGYGGALQSGFYGAKYDWIVYNDSDGQFDFSEVVKFLEVKDQADLILGYRIKRNDSFYRLVLAKGWALCLFLSFGLKLRDVDCGFKMVNKRVLRKIPRLESERGGMINAELAIKAKEYGFKLKQVGVHHYPRRAGVATGAQIRVIIKSFSDLFNLWRKLRLGL